MGATVNKQEVGKIAHLKGFLLIKMVTRRKILAAADSPQLTFCTRTGKKRQRYRLTLECIN